MLTLLTNHPSPQRAGGSQRTPATPSDQRARLECGGCQRIASARTEGADLRTALAEPPPPPPPTLISIDDLEWRAKAHAEVRAAREFAQATLDRLDQLPDLHSAAALRLSAKKTGIGPRTLDDLRQEMSARADTTPLYESWPHLDAAAELLEAIQPPISECSPEGSLLVRGDEEDIRRAAKKEAKEWQRRSALRFAQGERLDPDQTIEALERQSQRWQRRRLRREALRAQASWDTALRLARPTTRPGVPGSLRVSAYTLGAYRQRLLNSAAWSETQAVQFEDGTIVPLAEIQARGKKARRAMTYAVLKGMEFYGERNGYTPFFITLTVPGHYHSMIKGERAEDGTYPDAHPNPNWKPKDGPAAAWAHLTDMWRLLRSRLAKLKPLRDWFGISVPEPHHDGTPHLHALVWLPSHFVHVTKRRGEEPVERRRGTELILKDIMNELAPGHGNRLEIIRKREDRPRPDGTVRRFKTPASYVMKYVTADALDNSETHTANGEAGERHRAWAASRGIRRMRMVGAHGSLTVWQRIWTAGDKEPLPPRAAVAHAAMRRSESRRARRRRRAGFPGTGRGSPGSGGSRSRDPGTPGCIPRRGVQIPARVRGRRRQSTADRPGGP